MNVVDNKQCLIVGDNISSDIGVNSVLDIVFKMYHSGLLTISIFSKGRTIRCSGGIGLVGFLGKVPSSPPPWKLTEKWNLPQHSSSMYSCIQWVELNTKSLLSFINLYSFVFKSLLGVCRNRDQLWHYFPNEPQLWITAKSEIKYKVT